MLFRQKLLLSFIGMAVLACGAVGLASYQVSLRTQTESVRRLYALLLDQLARETDIRLSNIENTCRYMAADENLQRTLGQPVEGYGKVEFVEFMTRYGFPIINLLPVDSQVRLYVTNPVLPERYYEAARNPNPAPGDAFPRRFEVWQATRIAELPWRREMDSIYGYGTLWRQTEEDASAARISLLMNLYDFRTYLSVNPETSRLAIIRATVRLSDILPVSTLSGVRDPVRFVLADPDGQPLFFSGGVDAEQHAALRRNAGAEGYEALARTLRSGFTIEAYVPLASIRTEARKIWLLSTIITLSCMALFVALGILFSRYFGGYVHQLVQFIQHVRDGDFKSRLVPKTKDELYQVSMALNDMAETLDRLVNDVYVANMERTDANLRLLQAQINPHLLYNSLTSIGNLIRLNMPDKACDMVTALTSFYRISLSQGHELITVREEMDHATAYVMVRSIQFKDRVLLEKHVAPEAETLLTPKVILQPLVENIFKHALYMNRPIRIRLEACIEEDGASLSPHAPEPSAGSSLPEPDRHLVFRVSDDGTGMDPAMTDRLNEGGLEEAGVGLRNTMQRLRLKAGEGAAMQFASVPGEGTTVTIRLPLHIE